MDFFAFDIRSLGQLVQGSIGFGVGSGKRFGYCPKREWVESGHCRDTDACLMLVLLDRPRWLLICFFTLFIIDLTKSEIHIEHCVTVPWRV